MREFRLGKNDKAHYSSFAELANAWGVKESKKRSSNQEKLNSDREKFLRTCNVCKQTMTYKDGNVIVCSNPECKGFKHTSKNEDGTERVWYSPVFRLLDDKGEDIASRLFD